MKITKQDITDRFFTESKNLTPESKKNLLRELFQETILCHMKESGLFEKMAFHGGTSLRLLYRTERFSEDLDLSLFKANKNYNFESDMNKLESSLKSANLNFEFQNRSKSDNPVRKFFINDSEILKQLSPELGTIIPGEKIKIKIELDITPSNHQKYIQKELASPFKARITAHDLPTCMGQKIHATLCRSHFYGMDIIKGRDLYDLEWYLNNQVQPNLLNLKSCLQKGGPWAGQKLHIDNKWIIQEIQRSLKTKSLKTILEDLKPLIEPTQFEKVSSRWSKDYFINLAINNLRRES